MLVAKGKVGFVGYRAGVKATNPSAVVLVQYTGSFDNVAAGKQAEVDLVAKSCDGGEASRDVAVGGGRVPSDHRPSGTSAE